MDWLTRFYQNRPQYESGGRPAPEQPVLSPEMLARIDADLLERAAAQPQGFHDRAMGVAQERGFPGPQSAQFNRVIGESLMPNLFDSINRAFRGENVFQFDPALRGSDVAERAGYEGAPAAGLGMAIDATTPGGPMDRVMDVGRAASAIGLAVLPYFGAIRRVAPTLASNLDVIMRAGDRHGAEAFVEALVAPRARGLPAHELNAGVRPGPFGDGRMVVNLPSGGELSMSLRPYRDGSLEILELMNPGPAGAGGREVAVLLDLADATGTTLRTNPAAFNHREMPTPELWHMYNRAGFSPKGADLTDYVYVREMTWRRNPLPHESAERLAEATARLFDVPFRAPELEKASMAVRRGYWGVMDGFISRTDQGTRILRGGTFDGAELVRGQELQSLRELVSRHSGPNVQGYLLDELITDGQEFASRADVDEFLAWLFRSAGE